MESATAKCRGFALSSVSAVLSSLLCLLFLLLLTVIFCTTHFSSFHSFSPSKFDFSISVPSAQLHALVISASDDQIRAVSSSSLSANGSVIVDRFRNATFVVRNMTKLSREAKLERRLSRARASIRMAAYVQQNDDVNASVYRNAAAFYQSYFEMERKFKVYVYSEGDPPIVHDGPCKDIYTIEGRFIHEMEHGSRRFRTRNAEEAHVFFMPFSVTWMVKYMYKPLTYNLTPLRQFVGDYVQVVSTKYPFWNRTQGADHFMLACHDWGPHSSRGNSLLYNKSIRVLCNANTSEGFNPQKDVSLPEIYLYGGKVSPKLLSPPPANSSRPNLAFFAGGLHGPIRPILLHHWKDRDSDIRVYEYLPKGLDYYSLMLQSKFCLCPSGHEVASPRIVESIYAECVPVILSESYVLPFSDVLRWEAFSVQVKVSEIPRLKEVLSSVTEEEYRRLKEGLRAVRKHFELNQPAKRFDVFHMILHSIWLRRINMRLE